MTSTLATRKYWEKESEVSYDPKEKVLFNELFFRYLKKSNGHRVAIEIGCVPGLYLAYIYKHFDYFPEGIDFVKDVAEITGETLRNFGLNEYKIYTKDFL